MGIKARTTRHWIKVLKDSVYIEVENTGRSIMIQISLWKSTSERQDPASQSDISLPTVIKKVARSCRKGNGSILRKQVPLSRKSKIIPDPIGISIKNIMNNDIIDRENNSLSNNNSKSLQGFKPKTKKELLALDPANALNDRNALPLYLSYAHKYPESILRKVLGQVKEIPIREIKKSRGALFNYLIQQYEKETA